MSGFLRFEYLARVLFARDRSEILSHLHLCTSSNTGMRGDVQLRKQDFKLFLIFSQHTKSLDHQPRGLADWWIRSLFHPYFYTLSAFCYIVDEAKWQPGESMPNTKGTYFVALREFVIDRFGHQGWEQLLARLPADDRSRVASAVSIAWMPMEIRVRATHALVESVGRGDLQILKQFGNFEAERDLSSTQRFFLRMANPGYAMKKAGQYWRRFYDWGELQVERPSKQYAIARIVGQVVSDESYCLQFQAYLTRVFEMVGAKIVSVEHSQCVTRGDDVCTFEGKWE